MYVFFVLSRMVSGLGNEGYVSYGGYSGGLGNASVAEIDAWSCVNNQGALAFVDEPSFGISYDLRYGLKEFSTRTFIVASPMFNGVTSMQFSAFGCSLFPVYKTGLGYSRIFGERVGAGLHMDVFNFKLNAQESTKVLATFELGLLWEIREDLTIGFHLFNPPAVAYRIGSYEERMVVEYRFGFAYAMASKLKLNAEIAGNDRDQPIGRFGINYQPVESLEINLGFQSLGVALGAGVKYDFADWEVSFSCRQMQRAGRVYSISILKVL